jgi:anthranilate phosphoribosyltransferase
MNAAVALLIAGAVAAVPEGLERAAASIDSGAAVTILEKLVAVSQSGAGAQS